MPSDDFFDDDVTDEEELDAGLPSNFRLCSAKAAQRRRQTGGGYGQTQSNGTGGGYGASQRTNGIMKHFLNKVEGLDQQPAKEAKKFRLFISYCWQNRKDAVHDMARYLMKQQDMKVWIDMNSMAAGVASGTFEAMARGIDESDTVLVFFSQAYAESANCRREIEYAANKNKEILPIRVERGYRPDGWLLFIFKSQLRLDFCEGDSLDAVASKICDQIRSNNSQPEKADFDNRPERTVQRAPAASKNEDEQRILQQMQMISETPDDGCLIVCGDGGVGKTTLVARLLMDCKNFAFFANDCDVHRVFWINCFDWREQFDEKAFVDKILMLANELETDGGPSFSNISSITAYYQRKNMRVAFVLDDMFNFRVMQSFLEKHGESPICFVVTRDAQTIIEHDFSIVQKVERVDELSETGIREMLKVTYKLNKFLTDDQLMRLASLCCGLPLVASLIAARINNCEDKLEVRSEYKVLTSPQYRISKLKTQNRSFKTVSNLFSFSLDQMDASLRMLYYAFLLFNPAEPVSVFDLGVLWGFDLDDDFRCGLRGVCRAFEKRSLVRRVKRDICDRLLDAENEDEETKESKHETEKYEDAFEDRFLVHQMLYESAIAKAKSDLKLPVSLTEDEVLLQVRMKLAAGDMGSPDRGGQTPADSLSILTGALRFRRKALFNLIINRLDGKCLAELSKMKTASTNGLPFIFYLYLFEWDKPHKSYYPAIAIQKNTSYRLVRTILSKLIENVAPAEVFRVLTAQGTKCGGDDQPEKPTCLLLEAMHGMNSDHLDKVLIGAMLLRWHNQSMELQWETDLMYCPKQDNLVLAAFHNDVPEVERLLATEDEFDVGEAMRSAARKGHLEVVKAISKAHPDSVKSRDQVQLLPFTLAAKNGHIETVSYLFDLYPDAALSKDKDQQSTFQYACKHGQLECVKFMYEKSPKCMNQTDSENHTPLMISAMDGQLGIIKFICENCPEQIEIRDTELQCTALGFAAITNQIECVEFLFEKDTNTDNRGKAFIMAAANGKMETLNFFLKRCPEVASYTDAIMKGTAIMIAAGNGHFPIVEALYGKCKTEAMVQEHSVKFKMTAIMMAVTCGHLEITQFLFYKDPESASITFPSGENLVQIAERMGHAKIADFLRDNAS